MAESEIIVYAMERLRILLLDEVLLVKGVNNEVIRLQKELRSMLSFLEDADQSYGGDQRVRNWVSEVRNISYEVEEMVDTFISEISGERSTCFSLMCIIPRTVTKHNIGNRIQELNTRIEDICKSKERYDFEFPGGSSKERKSNIERIKDYRKTTSHGSEDEAVGLEDEKSIVVNQLINENWHRAVITISGMGGIGKTTLAQKIFNSPEIKMRFDCCAWVCVSEEYRLRDLLQRILNSFRKPNLQDLETMEKMSEVDLEDHLYHFLVRRRYLLVLDDVWHRQVWESLRRALPDDKNGSRVILTTRKKTSVLGDDKCFLHEMRFLTEEESWNLFCQRTSAGCCSAKQEFNSNPVLEQLARETVFKCGGLPLAIIVLGGLLSRRPINEWVNVTEHIWQHVTQDSTFVHCVLELSFNDLPVELKPCFIYFSVYPEDHLINVQKLIRLWVAEGFIKHGEREMEDLADEYLTELIDRSMIQQVEKSLGKTTVCKIHDSLRELAIQKAKDYHLLDIYEENMNSVSCLATVPFRRQAVHSGMKKYVSGNHPNSQLRSLMLFNLDQHICKAEEMTFVYSRFKLLRVLDLEDVKLSNSGKVDKIPSAIGGLIHLRYLALRNGNLSELPPSVGKLRSLQTLVAAGNFNWNLPAEIRNLTQLRHLIVRSESRLNISTLAQLRTLSYIIWEQYINIGIAHLTDLRELEIRKVVAARAGISSLDSLIQLRNLQSLALHTDNSFAQLPQLSHCKNLVKLKLEGKIEHLHEDLHQFPGRLKNLYLYNTKLRQDPFQLFGSLSTLTVLELSSDAYIGTQMMSTETGFSELEVLRLSWLPTLEMIIVDDKAMTKVRKFSIVDCKNVTQVPQRLRMLPIC